MQNEELLNKTPVELRANHKIRFHHLLADKTGRLVATIATRSNPDGTVDVAPAFVHERQGQERIPTGENDPKTGKPKFVREPPATRRAGREQALKRLVKGNEDGVIFAAKDAKYIIGKGPDTMWHKLIVSPKDIRVVRFTQEELKHSILNRTIVKFFPGQKWMPALRKRRPYNAANDKGLRRFAQRQDGNKPLLTNNRQPALPNPATSLRSRIGSFLRGWL